MTSVNLESLLNRKVVILVFQMLYTSFSTARNFKWGFLNSKHTHAHIHRLTQYTHTHSLSCTHTLILSDTHSPNIPCSHIFSYTHMIHIHSLTHILIHSHTLTKHTYSLTHKQHNTQYKITLSHTHTHTLAHTHIHSCTHTYVLCHSHTPTLFEDKLYACVCQLLCVILFVSVTQ